MRIQRAITEPLRPAATPWEERWSAPDLGLVACWERGREKSLQEPELAAQARAGRLVILAWKGGVEKAIKARQKVGTLFYLAMWQGLRGEDLDIDLAQEVVLMCTETGVSVVYTNDFAKYAYSAD